MMRRLVALFVLLLAFPSVAGQINGPLPYEASFPFSDPANDPYLNVVSGAIEAEVSGSGGPFAFFHTTGWSIEGLDKVCVQRKGQTPQCQEGDMGLVISDGGSAAIQFPLSSKGTITADHALAMFLTDRGDDVNGLKLNQSLLVPAVNGRMEFTDVPDVSSLAVFGISAPQGILVPASDDTDILVMRGGVPIMTLEGKSSTVSFAGTPDMAPFSVDNAILPFKEGSMARFSAADSAAAAEGLDPAHFATLMADLAASSASSSTTADEAPRSPLQDSLAEVLDAAMLRISNPQAGGAGEDEFAMVLFDDLAVSNTGLADLHYEGDAALQYADGEIAGAQPIYGVWYFQLPWWGWALWVVAIGLFIARLSAKPDRHHERWDQYKWVGWVAGGVALLLVFVMWDFEMRSVWGASVMSSDTSGTAFWITFAAQVLTMMLVLGAVAWPVNIIVKNGLLLGKQGTFMGLGKPIALVIAYLLGATLFLSYLELIVQSVVQAIANSA